MNDKNVCYIKEYKCKFKESVSQKLRMSESITELYRWAFFQDNKSLATWVHFCFVSLVSFSVMHLFGFSWPSSTTTGPTGLT